MKSDFIYKDSEIESNSGDNRSTILKIIGTKIKQILKGIMKLKLY